jgi:hypothetical protein
VDWLRQFNEAKGTAKGEISHPELPGLAAIAEEAYFTIHRKHGTS